MRELEAEIGRHDELYYQLAAPIITDEEYDVLLRELEDLERKHPELAAPDSPTTRVGGAPVPQLESVAHRQPMLSLANTYSREEVLEWCDSISDFLGVAPAEITFTCEPKLDGVAIEIVYEQGLLVRGITRGDGRVGDDVTHIVRTIRGLPHVLQGDTPPALLEVRGEVIMTRAHFEALNAARAEAGEDLFINPRNTASGTLKSLDPKVARQRPLSLVLYGLGQVDGFPRSSQWEDMLNLERYGLATGRHVGRRGALDDVLAHYDDLLARRDELPFEVDGAVIKLDDVALQERLGVRSRSPRWAIAFKFPARRGTSVVREIQVMVGRTGALTPRAVVEPVHVAGVTIEYVSLFNRDEVQRLGVKPGDRVIIERAGDVIPHIVGVSEDGGGEPFALPGSCPVCDTPVEEAEGEVVVRCPNPACPAVLKRRIEHFVARGGMDIEGVGEKLIEQLVEGAHVTRLADLYALDEETLAGLERMGTQSARNVLSGLEASRTRSFSKLLFALGIRHIGQHVAEVVAEHWPDLERLRAVGAEDLVDVAEIGPVVADSLLAWLADDAEQANVDALYAAGLAPVEPAPRVEGEGPLAGRTFLFTGTLEKLSRREANERVKAAGGKLLSGVSKNLDVLVVGAKPGSKLKKAQELGIEVLDEDAFLDLVGG